MNAQPDSTTIAATQTIIFEPTSAGGGSFWNGDNLLATLTVLKWTERQGRLSLRGTNHTYDMLRSTHQQRIGYRMIHNLRQMADADWNTGDPSATLHYKGQDYLATPDNLLSVRGDRLLLRVALAPNWPARQTELGVVGVADLPLIAFYLFVAYDLKQIVR